jgi:hypothetical protein
MSDDRYFNFPIQMLQDAFCDIKGTMDKIMDYAGYAHTLKLELGDDMDKMRSAGSYLGITYEDRSGSYKNGKIWYDSIPVNSPMVGINIEMCFDFFNNHKTQDDISVLLAFLAIKSIIGRKAYCKMTNEYLITRMGGYARIEDLPNPLPHPLSGYYTRRKLDKMKSELQLNWNVNIYSYYTRGFYVSIDNKFSLDKLVLAAERNRKSTREGKLRQQKIKARKKALRALRNPNK